MTDAPTLSEPIQSAAVLDARQGQASAWFKTLRDRICAAFEALEDEGAGGAISGRAWPIHLQALDAARGAAAASWA